jgi:riboflavin kinase/FMN adenylyltransferase
VHGEDLAQHAAHLVEGERLAQVVDDVSLDGGQRGRELGFPTANVAVPERVCLPADGVYAGTYVGEDGVERLAAISLGRRPTFYAESGLLLLEAYLLDFDGDLYGQTARVRFHRRLRGQERFESVDDLIAQMARDVAAVREGGAPD